MELIDTIIRMSYRINFESFYTISSFIVFLIIALVALITFKGIRQSLKGGIKKGKIRKWSKTAIEVIIVGAVVTTYFLIIMQGKVFFPYDETDIKYYHGFQNIIDHSSFMLFGTTVGLGYFAVPIILMQAFGIKDMFQLFPLLKALMLSLILIFSYLIYFFFRKTSRIKAGFALAAFLSFPAFVMSVRELKAIYFFVFLSTLASYKLMLKCKDKNCGAEYHLLFLLNYALGSLTRPEFLFFNFPILIDYGISQYKNIKEEDSWHAKEWLILVVFCLVLIVSIFPFSRTIQRVTEPDEGGNFLRNLNYLKDSFHNPNLFFGPVALSLVFIVSLLFFKQAFYYGIIYLMVLMRLMNSFYFDSQLFGFYFSIALIILFHRLRKKKAFYLAAAITIIFSLSIVFSNLGTIFMDDGSEIVEFFSDYKDKNMTFYTRYPGVFFSYLFRGTNITVFGMDEWKNLSNNEILLDHNCNPMNIGGTLVEFEKERYLGSFMHYCKPKNS